jgi:hypothetical protein
MMKYTQLINNISKHNNINKNTITYKRLKYRHSEVLQIDSQLEPKHLSE